MPELTVTVPDYNPVDWPPTMNGVAADLIIDDQIVAVFEMPDAMADVMEIAKLWAAINRCPVRWRMYDIEVIHHCGIEYPPIINRRKKKK